MSIKVCTAEHMISTTAGMGMARSWFPRIVAERFATSTKDGTIERAPDPVTMIETDLTWFNTSGDDEEVEVSIHRAPRSITTSNPNTITIEDAFAVDIGFSPSAGRPTVTQNALGARLKIDRSTVAKVGYGRLFVDTDDWTTLEQVGVVPAGQGMHFRYIAAVVTPGEWRVPENNPRFEAYARWARLIATARPSGVS